MTNRRIRWTLTIRFGVAVWLVAPLFGQTSRPHDSPATPRPSRCEQDFAKLRRDLDVLSSGRAPETSGAILPTRSELLMAFVAKHGATSSASTEVLTARCQLATLQLGAFRARAARRQYRHVLVSAPRRSLDLRGCALFGLSQAAELTGDIDTARDRLDELIEDPSLRGSRYARYAAIARSRFQTAPRVQVGSMLPGFGPTVDIDGKSRQRADLSGATSLLVFVSLADEESHVELQRLLETATDNGLPANQIVLFALHGDRNRALEVRQRQAWTQPMMLCNNQFIDENVMRYAVHELPTTYLVGADGTLLSRSPTPRRLADALARSR